ncbi:hypothetical protein Ssi03_11750 [Sphaerisporangium siamense]|uniref:Uncharacterized protein n=1 Tax=Sphaerisporangium siamense TaxID=795645 RepID=A0A7W7DA26_9ACTN|nr:hypothetical protein [Sphaerisporangium siamense]MBB4703049.1 hypothetical protein [Sphaerisporangium siamense]GII83185.1 hypothetical protein Ssi03_11750 [Sphaerisporangium siamense]
MDADSMICLSDLVPVLRWSRPQQVADVLADPRLPGGWWASVALSRALGTTGVEWLCDRLSRLAVSRWDHLALTELLPALQVHKVDPALPGWPEPARSAIGGIGGWQRLRRLTAADLRAPAIAAAPETILTAVFREVIGRVPAVSAPAPAGPPTGPAQDAAARPVAQVPAPPPVSDNPLVRLVDAVFREWTPLERAVAIERLFAEEPVSLRTLAHELHVDRDVLSQAQRAAEERVLHWLRSPEGTPVTGHLFRLTEWLGNAATEEQLIGADPAHPIEVPSLGTPLWRVLVALMPDRRLQDGWLVVGDLTRLRERTAQMLGDKTSGEDAVELLAQVGIRAHSAQAWIEALPKVAARPPEPTTTGGFAPLPRRTPGANGHQMRGGVPVPSVAGNLPDAQTAQNALAALTALSGPPRPHLVPEPRAATHAPPLPGPASDPRRWQRIDVTSEHLRGEPVPVPEGYATQLGMRPGTLLSVTGPGDNAVVLVWRDRQPVFDSLQPVLMRLNARPGDSVYVTVDGYRLDAQLTS